MELLNRTELPKPEEKITLYGVTWQQYDTLVSMFMDQFPGLRMTFLEGTLEIMGTSSEHERLKKIIARLLEMYAVEKRITLNGYGNTTFRKEAKQIILYRLRQGEYAKIDRSEFLPDLDLVLLSKFVNYDNQTEAVIAYRDDLSN